MINLTQEEIWGFNIFNNVVENARLELNRAVAGRESFIRLLEAKYNATFNPQSGQLEEKKE